MSRSHPNAKAVAESSEEIFKQIMKKIKELRMIRKKGIEEAQMTEYEIALRVLKNSGWKMGLKAADKGFTLSEIESDLKEIRLPAQTLVFDKGGRLLKTNFLSLDQVADRMKDMVSKPSSIIRSKTGIDWNAAERELLQEDVLRAYFIQLNSETKRAYILGALNLMEKIVEDLLIHGISEEEEFRRLIERFRAYGGRVSSSAVSF